MTNQIFRMGIIKNKIRAVVTLVPILLVLFSLVPVKAQEAGGSGLSISPTVSQFMLKPGQADVVNINLKNITGGDIVAQASVSDFVSDNFSGTPRIIIDPDKISPNSIKKFVGTLQNVSLAKGEQKKAPVTIQIPPSTPPGAYFGILRYKAVPTAAANAAKPGEVALTASVGSIVLITVPGNLREQVQLSGLHVYSKDKKGTFFATKPDQIGIEVKNLGNGFAQPFGTVEIRSTLGSKAYSYQFNNSTPRPSVLPDSSRTFKDAIKNINQPGRYTVTASVAFGDGSNILVAKKTFWYFPVWMLAALLVLLAVLALLTYHFRNRQKSVKRSTSKRRR